MTFIFRRVISQEISQSSITETRRVDSMPTSEVTPVTIDPHTYFQGHGHIWGLGFNRYLWFSFRGNQTIFNWDMANFYWYVCFLFLANQRYSEFLIWPWTFKVKVMAKVKPDDPIWGLAFNRYVCFLFRGNQTIIGWDTANSTFDLEHSRSRSWPRSNPMIPLEA